jgi:hypothetical protein
LPSRIIIMDVMGRKIEVRDRPAGRHVIQTEEWPPGIYLARILNAAGVETIPFMLE